MEHKHPPRWADRFLEWYCRPDLLEEIQGDSYELFHRHIRADKRKADRLFVWNVIRFLRWKNIRKRKRSQPSASMLNNHLKIGIRNLVRHKAFSLINVFGLTIGLTCFMLIGAFIYDELSYDKYPTRYGDIYRVGIKLQQDGGTDDYPHVDIAVAAGIEREFPEVAASTRVTGESADYILHNNEYVREESIVFADSNFLKIFSIPLIDGNADLALSEPNSIVISKELAVKYFGNKPALGEIITLRRRGALKVTGVFDKIPEHSHFHYHAFVSMVTAPFINNKQTWSNVGFYTYLLLQEHVDVRLLESKLPMLVEKYVVPEIQQDMELSLADAQKSVSNWKFYLMPVSDIHLYSHSKYEIEANGDINNVYIFGVLAVFILLLACINFMNLSTARSARRGMEIGIRKVLGSLKSQLMSQFLVESVMFALIALAFAILFISILLPFFNHLTGKHIGMFFFLSPQVIAVMMLLACSVGVAAGIYPAVFLSSFKTLKVLKSNTGGSYNRGGLRSALVVFQFTISTGLIVATIVAYQQLQHMQNIKLGYSKDQVVVIENAGQLRLNQFGFKERMKADPRVVNVSNSSVPIGPSSSFGGSVVSPKESNTSNVYITILSADYDFIETMGMEIEIGRNFSREFLTDSLGENVIINETAMRDLGWNESNVIGSTIVRTATRQHRVVGVVKDFHFTTAKEKIAPLMIEYRGLSPAMLVKVSTNDLPNLLIDLEKNWKSLIDIPFSFYFLDDRFDNLYRTERSIEKIFIVFMIIAVLIASLGLYGLSAHAAEQRLKEIGIRKVLGSSVRQIVFLQSRDFLMPVLLAIVIAAPLSWWAMEQWLMNFGYRIGVNGWVIVLSGLSAIVIAMVTVSFQAVKAATTNPVDSLRAE